MHQEWNVDQFEGHGEKPLCGTSGRINVVGFDDARDEPSWGVVYIPEDADTISFLWRWAPEMPLPPAGQVAVMEILFAELPDGAAPPTEPYATARVALAGFLEWPRWYGAQGFTFAEIGLRPGAHRFWLRRAVGEHRDPRDTLVGDFIVEGIRMLFEKVGNDL